MKRILQSLLAVSRTIIFGEIDQTSAKKVVLIGCHKRHQKALKTNWPRVPKYVDQMLEMISFSTRKLWINLIVVSNAELGLTAGGMREETYARAQERGYFLCPPDVGLALAARKYQPEEEKLLVAMEPIELNGWRNVFLVGDNGWLGVAHGRPDLYFGADDQWVFSLGTKALWKLGLWRFLKALFS